MSKDWEKKVEELNKLHQELQNKPDSEKKGYALHPGAILNAYREGDISFEEALDALQRISIFLPPDRFLALKELCIAFKIAEESKVTFAELKVTPYGSISWSQGGEVIIDLC